MKIFYAGPFVGEFGYELFCWNGWLRKKKKDNNSYCVIACKKGHEILYEDFADEIISCDIQGERSDMWMCHDVQSPSFKDVFNKNQDNNTWFPPNTPFVRYDHDHNLDNERFFNQFKNQSFVPLGDKSAIKYDILIHARCKNNKVNGGVVSGFRNWPTIKWREVFRQFKKLKIACIGTSTASSYIGGEDLRGVDLKTLCNIMCNSRCIIGPSSGPMHLASLAQCPQITWWGTPYGSPNKIRYLKDWNPFNVKVSIVNSNKWNIESKDAIKAINVALYPKMQ